MLVIATIAGNVCSTIPDTSVTAPFTTTGLLLLLVEVLLSLFEFVVVPILFGSSAVIPNTLSETYLTASKHTPATMPKSTAHTAVIRNFFPFHSLFLF